MSKAPASGKKRFWQGFASGFVAAFASLVFVGVGIYLYGEVISKTHSETGPALWEEEAEGGGLRVILNAEKRRVAFARGAETHAIVLPEHESAQSPVVSADGHAAFVFVRTDKGENRYILSCRFENDSLSTVKTSRLLEVPAVAALLGRTAWINRIYRASADGHRLVLNVLVDNSQDAVTAGRPISTYFTEHAYVYDIDRNTLALAGDETVEEPR